MQRASGPKRAAASVIVGSARCATVPAPETGSQGQRNEKAATSNGPNQKAGRLCVSTALAMRAGLPILGISVASIPAGSAKRFASSQAERANKAVNGRRSAMSAETERLFTRD